MRTRKKNPHALAHQLAQEWATTDIRGASEMLGFKSNNSVRTLIANGELPAYRISNRPGSSIRIRISDVIALLQPVVPRQALEHARSRQPGPLHQPLPIAGDTR